MPDFEKLGVFYLGKIIDPSTGKMTDKLLLYDSKNLTTHAVCVGMTGSGKTGLGIVILEEAGLDSIPAIIIDPKGDLGNLLLTFPSLSAEEFKPWIDPVEAERKSITAQAYAEETAKTWKEGLAEWDEDSKRIEKLKKSVDMVIYTPANTAGRPISILSSFAAPPKEVVEDTGALRDRVLALTSSLLGLLGVNADPIKSREHILISTIIDQAWREGKDLDLATLIQKIQKPPFEKIGALDIDTFFPLKDRMALSVNLNNLLASPGFQAWMEGDPLDVQQLLYSQEGKPKFSIFSISHLSDSERMFFVTLLLNEIISWMRRQPGTSSLKALLYMDEIFGYFPPIAVPPSKLPMLTLLKQARAYGLGVVLATQNPVDLDYKGLSNCGTWFIGKLQTERDKGRVTEGLRIASNGEIDTKILNEMLSTISKRTFIMRSIYEKDPIIFRTRWTMSYLRGPLTLTQIQSLTDKMFPMAIKPPKKTPSKEKFPFTTAKPVIPSEITEYFVNKVGAQQVIYKPLVMGNAKLHFVNAKNKIDLWQEYCILAPADQDGKIILWEEGNNIPTLKNRLSKDSISSCVFGELPSGLMQAKNYSNFQKTFTAYLYQTQSLTIYFCPELNLTSKEGESESDFKARVTLALREKRDKMIQDVRDKYGKKMTELTSKLRKAQEKVERKQENAGWRKIESVISFATALLGALFGRGVTKGTITQTGTSIRKAGKIGAGNQEAEQAQQDMQDLQQQLEDLRAKMQNEIDETTSSYDISKISIDETNISPRKSDISLEQVALVWVADSAMG